MRTCFYTSLCLLLVLKTSFVHAQHKVTIPGYTGYAVPAENDEDEMFAPTRGLINWTNPHQIIQYFSVVEKAGVIDISINARSEGGAQLHLSAAGHSFT